uniref:Heat shock transcription factor 1 n=1 Tax=Coturnix japonica TaxID=93934 RepID=A0A8C2T725_COTJA
MVLFRVVVCCGWAGGSGRSLPPFLTVILSFNVPRAGCPNSPENLQGWGKPGRELRLSLETEARLGQKRLKTANLVAGSVSDSWDRIHPAVPCLFSAGFCFPCSENEALWREVASLRQKHAQQQKVVNKLIQFLISLVQSNRILGVKRKIPLMLNDSSSAHSMPKYSRQYSLEHVHGSSPYAASSPAYSGSNIYSPDSSTNSGPIISDVTELAQSSPSASPSGSLDERSSPVVRIKEEPPSPSRSPKVEEASPGNPPAVETPLSPSTFIDSILQENEPSTTTATAGNSTAQPQPQEKCLSVACLDKNELNDHLDTIDSNLDNLQTMLTTHGFSVDTSALLDPQHGSFLQLFSPSMTVTDMNLPDLDSSLASVSNCNALGEPLQRLQQGCMQETAHRALRNGKEQTWHAGDATMQGQVAVLETGCSNARTGCSNAGAGCSNAGAGCSARGRLQQCKDGLQQCKDRLQQWRGMLQC